MIKLVCFDLDDTLIRGTDSVRLLCVLSGKKQEALEIEEKERTGLLDWMEADEQKVALAKGLSLTQLAKEFVHHVKPLEGIPETVAALAQRGIRSIIITAGPRQVALAAREQWGFDAAYGSDYQEEDGKLTGKILQHTGDAGKVAYLEEYCGLHRLAPNECVAVGDGFTDIPLFEHCGMSIAINAAAAARLAATHAIDTDSLTDILPLILES